MGTRERIADSINEARALLHEAGVAARERTDFYGADAEDDPEPASSADVDAVIAGWKRDAEETRAYVAKHGEKWPEHVRQRWLVRAEELEWLHEQHAGLGEARRAG